MRNSTLANTEAVTMALAAPRRKRELTELEKKERDERRAEKEREDKAIKIAADVNKESRAQQAEARLKYLLSQSDIFSHFGNVKKGGGAGEVSLKRSAPSNASMASSSSAGDEGGDGEKKAKKRGRKPKHEAAQEDEMDDDERAMAADIGYNSDEDTGASTATPAGTILLTQPKCIAGGQMRAYQLEGLNWMIRLTENGINGILADEMGLGKTLQSISLLGYLYEFKNIRGPHLIMVPKSTLSNWMNEFTRWCPVLRVVRFHGSKEEREEQIRDVLKPGRPQSERDWDVVVTTYEVLNLEKTALTKIAWNYLVIDEAHRLKNEVSQFSQSVRALDTQHRLLLTGTPLQNNLHELWALLNFLLPDIFASSEQFDDWFNLDVDDTEAKQRIIGQLHKILRPFMLRRLKADVEKGLPPKSETILFTGLSAMQKQLYKQILLRDIDAVNGNSGSRTAILNIVMQLRKCCNHPYLFPGLEDRSLNPHGEHLFQNCGKMILLDKLLKKLFERGHRVLIFSQMTRMLDILEDYLISRGYTYCRIDGNTTYEEREDRIHEYNMEGSTKFIFLLSTRAGGLGINLQTADTVILYDSDWNPQADLQAQDRAHRIGQKKPVQVYRLVTDDTVEVKVVERAQQKLKLDAMVVQQGRLQDKEKKLSKQDLLESIRFGADKIFRAKDTTDISDADIDIILEEGKKKTKEMTDKLQEAEKGDLYDFRLDGGFSAQVFEGKDYSRDARAAREAESASFATFQFIDTGKRERKVVSTYAEQISRTTNEPEGDKRPKIPRHLRLPKMEEWQFYQKDRLNELHDEELKLFDALVDANDGTILNNPKLQLLTPEQQEEKARLLAQGFGDWTKVHYNCFIRSSARYGRNEFEKIAREVSKPVEEVKRYAEVYWNQGPTLLTPNEWERNLRKVEAGEKKHSDIVRMTEATKELIMMFDDPWEELTFKHAHPSDRSKVFNAVEDRFLLCLTHLHGYGAWDLVRSSIRRCERFRFDFYLQSCSTEALSKRCEALMRAAEREVAEIARKKGAGGVGITEGGQPSAGGKGQELTKDRMFELTKQIDEEAKRLSQLRAQLMKAKNPTAAQKAPAKATLAPLTSSSSSSGPTSSSSSSSSPPSSSSAAADGDAKSKNAKSTTLKPVPDHLLPALCNILAKHPADGINKISTEFNSSYPEVSKRQAEIKIGEMAVKEKRGDDTRAVWYIKDEYLHHVADKSLLSENYNKKRKAEDEGGNGAPKKPKAAKKKKEDGSPEGGEGGAGGGTSSSASGTSSGGGDAGKMPKKSRRAFNFYVEVAKPIAIAKLKQEKESNEVTMGGTEEAAENAAAEGGDGKVNKDDLKNLIKKMWDNLSAEERAVYEKKEEEDQARYEREMQAWEAAGGGKKE